MTTREVRGGFFRLISMERFTSVEPSRTAHKERKSRSVEHHGWVHCRAFRLPLLRSGSHEMREALSTWPMRGSPILDATIGAHREANDDATCENQAGLEDSIDSTACTWVRLSRGHSHVEHLSLDNSHARARTHAHTRACLGHEIKARNVTAVTTCSCGWTHPVTRRIQQQPDIPSTLWQMRIRFQGFGTKIPFSLCSGY